MSFSFWRTTYASAGFYRILFSNLLQVLFAYHIEALVPSNPNMAQSLQKMNTIVHKDVQFFRAGRLNGRTLIVSVKKDGVRSSLQPEDSISLQHHSPTALFMSWNLFLTR